MCHGSGDQINPFLPKLCLVAIAIENKVRWRFDAQLKKGSKLYCFCGEFQKYEIVKE